ncbi:MAG: Ig-like domain-containing protein [Vulcanimicrobiota bacterium]
MTFNFIKAQAPLEVPVATTSIRFRFYEGVNGSGALLQTEVRDFANSITIQSVDSRTRSVVITALAGNGFPILETSGPLQVISRGEVTMDFSNTTSLIVTLDSVVVSPTSASTTVGGSFQFVAAVNFSNGDVLAGPVGWQATGQASINETTGLATGTADGEGSITATAGGVTSSPAALTVGAGLSVQTVEIMPNTPDPVVVQSGGNTLQFSVLGFDQNGNPIATGPVSWTVASNNGTTIDISTGLLTSGSEEATTADDVVVTATAGLAVGTQNVNVLDIPGDITSIDTTPEPLTLTLDQATTQLTTQATFENGSPMDINSSFGLVYTSTDPGVVGVDSNGTVTILRQGSTTITASVAGMFALVPDDVIDVTVDFGAGGNQNPTLAVTGGVGNQSNSHAFASVAFDDDQQNLVLGAITLTADSGAEIVAPPTSIGQVDDANPGNVIISLDTEASPAAIASYLQTIQVDTTSSTLADVVCVSVVVTDGQGGTSPLRTVEITVGGIDAVLLRIDEDGPVVVGQSYTSIQAAVDYVAALADGRYSIISAAPGDFTNDGEAGTIRVADAFSLQFLTLNGANQGISVGVEPGTRAGESRLERITVDNNHVTIDGFRFETGNTDDQPPDNVEVAILMNDDSDNLTVKNSLFLGGPGLFDRGIAVQNNFDAPADVTVSNSNFTGWDNAIRPEGAGSFSILRFTATGNSFIGNGTGVFFLDVVDAVVTGNGFLNQTDNHIWIRLANGLAADFTGNEFTGTGVITTFNANNMGSATVDTSGSWWGQISGPMGQLNPGLFTTIVTDPARTRSSSTRALFRLT